MTCRNQTRLISSMVALATLATTTAVMAAEVDLTTAGSTAQSLTGTVGGTALFQNFQSQPTGTGVFDPFLTINSPANSLVERGYNTAGFTDGLFLDQQRPEWNNLVKLSDLAVVTVNNAHYYAFELDADEPQNAPNNLISIDNIRIYTSATDNTTSVGNNDTQAGLAGLGTLRWAMNDPLKDANGNYIDANWVNLDANNHGQGESDMIAYIPVAAFAGAASSDFLWFYNVNGVHEAAQGVAGTGATAGFEEWRAVVGPTSAVPDGGSTLMLLGSALGAIGLAGRRLKGLLKL